MKLLLLICSVFLNTCRADDRPNREEKAFFVNMGAETRRNRQQQEQVRNQNFRFQSQLQSHAVLPREYMGRSSREGSDDCFEFLRHYFSRIMFIFNRSE